MTVILTVEDEFLVSEFLGHVLTSAGYEVVAAANADDAIAILEKRDDIRIVITDINMPGSMDGLKLAAAVKGRWPPIRIIVATGAGKPRAEECRSKAYFCPSLTRPQRYWQRFTISACSLDQFRLYKRLALTQRYKYAA